MKTLSHILSVVLKLSAVISVFVLPAFIFRNSKPHADDVIWSQTMSSCDWGSCPKDLPTHLTHKNFMK